MLVYNDSYARSMRVQHFVKFAPELQTLQVPAYISAYQSGMEQGFKIRVNFDNRPQVLIFVSKLPKTAKMVVRVGKALTSSEQFIFDTEHQASVFVVQQLLLLDK